MVSPLRSRLEAFTRLSHEDRLAIERVARKSVRDVAARRDLIHEGDNPRFIYLMLEGWACRYKSLPDGRRQIVAFFIPGDLCDLNIYILSEMDHSVGALTPLRVAEIGRDDFETLTATHPSIVQALWWHELVMAAIQREWTLNVGQRTAFERLAHLFCEMFLRLQTVGLTLADRCEWPLTQVDLADATGLTAVHVNRTLQELRKAGLIELHNRQLRIPDLARLKQAALFNDNYLHLKRERAYSGAAE